jgi:hypothetical protein
MKPFLMTYIIGLLLVLLGDRIIGGESTLHYVFLVGGIIILLLSMVLAKSQPSNIREDQKTAFQLPFFYTVVGVVSVVLYLLGGELFLKSVEFSEDGARKWSVFMQSFGAVLWLSAIFPLVALHSLISSGMDHINDRRATERSLHWLTAAFIIASLFPINYIANDTNKRWDLGYFKTAMPGESSQSLVANLAHPTTAYLFFPNGKEVTEEIRTYFDQVNGPNFNVVYVDQALEPELSEDLNIRQNGYVVFVKGEGDERQVERIKIGTDFSSAKRVLKKLDEEIREGLLKIAKDTDVIYFTTGHGEMYWKLEEGADQSRKISNLKKGMKSANFSLKELNISNGLANEVPEDAKSVVILSPLQEFTGSEIIALENYWKTGGSIFVALDPGGATLEPLLTILGVSFNPTPLGHSNIYLPASSRPVKTDKRNIVTNKFSTHASVTSLSRNNKVMQLIFPNAGSLTAIKDSPNKVKEIIKTLEDTWSDSNNNYERDPDEAVAVWNIAMAVTNETKNESDETTIESKAVVFADATWLNDTYLAKGYKIQGMTIQPHVLTLSNTLFWLAEQEGIAGTVSNENDIKVQHSKEGQSWMFFSTIMFVPMGIFGVGFLRIRKRKNKGAQS